MSKKKRKVFSGIMFMIAAMLLIMILSKNALAEAGGCTDENYFCACGDRCHGPYEVSSGFNILNTTQCMDGPDMSDYEYTNELTVTNLNSSNFKGGDLVRVYAQFFCYSGDYISIAYANTSNVKSTSWRNIYSGVCTSYSLTDVYVNITLDRVAGFHAVRAIIAYPGAASMTCGYPPHTSSDTDDLFFRVNERPDIDPPTITYISPTPGTNIEYTQDLEVPISVNATDETGIKEIIANITWDGGNLSLNLTNTSSGSYMKFNNTAYNLTNVSRYNITIYAVDTRNNSGINTSYFFLTNNAFLNISSPVFGRTYPYRNVSFMFKIHDNSTPYQEVYYILNSGEKNYINESIKISNENSVWEAETNELINLSQTFTPTENMTVSKVSLRMFRESPNFFQNKIQLRNGTNESNSTLLLEYTLNSTDVSDEESVWVTINFSNSTELRSGMTYMIMLTESADSTDIYSWETNFDEYAYGSCLKNPSMDLLFKINDDLRYMDVLNASEGTNTLSACEINALNYTKCALTSFKTDTIPPSATIPDETSDPFEFGPSVYQFISINITDETSTLSRVMIMINNTNQTMNYTGPGGRYQYRWFINNSDLNSIRNYSYMIFYNDSAGNYNITPEYKFTVVDSTAPQETITIHTPSSENEIDPGQLITVNTTLTEYTPIINVTLQYGLFNASSNSTNWTDKTMHNSSGSANEWLANFTPSQEGIWKFRIVAKDLYNNTLTTNQTNISVYYDFTWDAQPEDIPEVFTTPGTYLSIGNVTIENTGDFQLNFSLQKFSGTPNINFDEDNVSVDAKSNHTIGFSGTAPVDLSQYPYSILVSCKNPNASLHNKTLSGSIAVGQGGAYVTLSDILYPTSVIQGQRRLLLNVTIKNIGNETAYNITVNWSLPNEWSVIGNLSKFIGNLTPYTTTSVKAHHDLLTSVGLNASLGIQNITLTIDYAMEPNSTRPAPIIKQVEVTELVIDIPEPEPTPAPGGGGGGGGGGRSGGGGIIIPVIKYNLTLDYENRISILRGTSKTIEINITNKNEVIFRNISFTIAGFPSSKVNIEPDMIAYLGSNQTKTINVSFNIPVYMGYAIQNLSMMLRGQTKMNENSSERDYEQEEPLTLIISEADQTESLACLTSSELLLSEMESMNFTTEKLHAKLEEAKNAFANLDYTLVKSLCEEIGEAKDISFKASSDMLKLEEEINRSEKEGYDVKGTRRLLELAQDMFTQGEYDKVLERVSKAAESLALQIQIEDAKLGKRLYKLVRNYWWAIIMTAIIGVAFAAIAYKKNAQLKIKAKIESLGREEETIGNLLKQLQHEHFVDKSIGTRIYSERMADYKKRLAEIAQERIDLGHKQVEFFKTGTDIEGLTAQKEELTALVKKLQDDYFMKNSIDKDNYTRTFSIYKKKLAELNKKIAIKDAEEKEETGKRVAFLRGGEQQ